MAELTKEELEKVAKEKAEQAKKIASEAVDKVKNISADDAKELAKEKAEEATKAAKEAAEKLKNMSADDAKKLAQEKLESMKSLDNSAKLKYGGIALVVILLLSFVFGGSSYPEEFIKAKLKAKSLEVVSFNIESEEEFELMGLKGVKLVVEATYKTVDFTCERERGNEKGAERTMRIGRPDLFSYKTWDKETKYTKTEKECMKEYSNIRNQKVTAKPGAEVTEIRTITFGKEDIIRWEAKQK